MRKIFCLLMIFGVCGRVESWAPRSWEGVGVPYQIPPYDPGRLQEAVGVLEKKTPLVFAGECRALQKQLGETICGNGFVLMGGDCAETFSGFSVNRTRDDFLLLLRMSMVLSYGGGVPVTPIGRMAGQFAKPRTVLWDDVYDCRAYQGDIINGLEIDQRHPDPSRMIMAYHQSVQTLNLIRAFRHGGIDNLEFLNDLNARCLVETTDRMTPDIRERYHQHMNRIQQTIRFMKSTTGMTPSLGRFYTGHECLLLPYEAALTRKDSTTDDDRWYDTSSHFLWLGERTRKKNASHVEFLRGIHNPIGIKVSASTDIEELREIVSVLNPDKHIGRITLISRMGANVLPLKLPAIVRAMSDQPILWCTDPMHGNTFEVNKTKTRSVQTLHNEIIAFFRTLRSLGVKPGGIHLEMTSQNVTECIGGELDPISTEDLLSDRYESVCDPRLNGAQALETAFLVSDLLQME